MIAQSVLFLALACLLLQTNGQYSAEYVVTMRSMSPTLAVGQPFELICEINPRPVETVTWRWYYRGVVVGTGERFKIDALDQDDIGNYECHATVAVRTGREPLQVKQNSDMIFPITPEKEIEMIPPPGRVMISLPGEVRELHCEYDVSNPQRVYWFFNGSVLESHPRLNRTGRVFRIDRLRVGIITLNGVENDHAGKYECRVDGVVKEVYVIMAARGGMEVSPPEEILNEGETVEFHCRSDVEKGINRQMVWYFKSFNDPAERELDFYYSGFRRNDDVITSQTSFISKIGVVKADEGEYICRIPSKGYEERGKLYVHASAPLEYFITITPMVVRTRAYEAIQIECKVMDSQGRPAPFVPRFRTPRRTIYFDSDELIGRGAIFRIPRGLSAAENGIEVECYTDTNGLSATAIIYIEDSCPLGYRRCQSGECLLPGQFCDGRIDCADRSDEDPRTCLICEPSARKCEYHGGQAPTKDTYMVHWTCDGEQDCGNGFDEVNCPRSEFAQCGGTMFQCDGSQREISMAFVCDTDRDCPYGEDERNCAPPTIQAHHQYHQVGRRGESVTMQCTVTGFPAPRVIWRFNWGCLPEEGFRFRVSSEALNCGTPMVTIVSTLTISGIVHSDAGIYNCEGLSGVHRAMSSDYVLRVD